MAKKNADLSSKEQIFIREVLRTGNATKAAVLAGYSAATAGVTGSKLLRKAKVSAELANLREKLLQKIEIDAERVLQGIAQVAFFDVRKFFNADGSLKAVADLDEVTAFALKGLDVEKLFHHFGKGNAEEKGTITKVRFADRLAALELLGRNLKLFTDKLEVSDPAAVIERLKAGRARVAGMKRIA